MYKIFGYTKNRLDDWEMPFVKMAELYCEGKPFWWRWFFGWRGTFRGENGFYCYYILPRKIFRKIYLFAEKYLDISYEV